MAHLKRGHHLRKHQDAQPDHKCILDSSQNLEGQGGAGLDDHVRQGVDIQPKAAAVM